MPVSAELVVSPSEQDIADIEKIYAPGDVPSFDLMVAGRFNDRLLGAFTLHETDAGHWQMRDFQVREITRKRGVATQLIKRSLPVLPENVNEILVDLSPAPFLVAAFLEAGFEVADNVAHWQRP